MSSPFDPLPTPVPVTVVTRGPLPADPSARIIHLDPALHPHEPGAECVACAARSDIRAMLFDLLTASRTEQRPLTSVIVDASDLADPARIIASLEAGAMPANGLRDHTVARSFRLARVLP